MSNEVFSCYIIGEDTIAIQCAEVLLELGHIIYGVVSPNFQLKEWACQHKLNYFEDIDVFQEHANTHEFDYLFSIVNNTKLSDAMLQLPRQFAINFHDAPLPRYAGRHATSWALINQEKKHGISWHIISGLVDAGDILKQESFTIESKETALSFNLKCYNNATEAFRSLVNELAQKRYIRVKQDLSQRSFYGANKKPVGNGLISWCDSAISIESLCRALDFGGYTNRLAMPKFLIKGIVFSPGKLKILRNQSGCSPGTIVKLSKNYIQIATATSDLAMYDVRDMRGLSYASSDLIKKFALKINDKLFLPDGKLLKKLEELGTAFAKHEAFWVKQLANMHADLILPFSVNNPIAGAMEQYGKSNIADKLKAEIMCRFTKGTSFEYILLAAILIYFYRVNQAQNFSINFGNFNLSQLTEDTKGFFASYLPLATNFQSDESFAAIVKLTAQQIELFQKHYTYSLDIILRYPELKKCILNKAIRIDLIDSLENYYPAEDHQLVVAINKTDKQFYLFLKKELLRQEYFLQFIGKLFDHITNLFTSVVRNAKQTVTSLSLLSEAERNTLLYDWNNTYTTYPANKTVIQIFEEQVAATPNNIAVKFAGDSLTYKEFNAKVNQLAHYLRRCSIKKGAIIPICVERSLEMVIGIHAILKAGGAYLPIDPSYPKIRVKYMLEDSAASIVLTHSSFGNLFKGIVAKKKIMAIKLDKDWCHIRKESTENPPIIVVPKDIVYVIYTSGSTGQPKGVVNVHSGLFNRICWMQDKFKLGNNDVVLQKTPFSFDVSVWEFIWPFLFGASLVVALPEEHKSPSYIAEIILREKITTIHFVPSMLEIFLEQAGDTQYKSLKRVICSGEALSYRLQQHFYEKFNTAATGLFNLYGPTEASIDVSSWDCGVDLSDVRTVPIGKPIANTQLYVLDKKLQPVPVGIPGELYIGGVGLALGYLNKLDLTKSKFIPDPFSSDSGARLYQTGDLVCWLPNANLNYICRLDNQIKLHGLRIEIGEIESYLLKYSKIKQAVVVVNKSEAGGDYLSAYLVLNKAVELDSKKLKRRLLEDLPVFMVPTSFFVLDKLPLSQNGKLDYKALPRQKEQLTGSIEYQPPTNILEKKLMKIWSTILNIPKDKIGIHDDFFELGGDSIISMRIIARAKQQGLCITIKQLFQHPSIFELARLGGLNATIKSNFDEKDEGEALLTPIQHWFFEQQIIDKNFWNHICVIKLKKSINVEYLKQTLRHLINFHDVFRLRFRKSENGWKQHYVLDKNKLYFETIDLPQETLFAFNKAANLSFKSLKNRINIAKGPLLQASLVNLKNKHSYLLLFVHHLITDGVSWQIFISDLQSVYDQLVKGKTPMVGSKTDSFKKWSVALKNYASSKELHGELQYWLDVTRDKINLPVDYCRGPNNQLSIDYERIVLNKEKTQYLLTGFAGRHSLSILVVLLAALVRIFNRNYKQSSLLLNLENHGREEIAGDLDLSRTVGWFTALFPFRLDLINSDDLKLILQSVKRQLLSIPKKGVGFGVLRYLVANSQIKKQLKDKDNALISFNYFGQFDRFLLQKKNGILKLETIDLVSNGGNSRSHILDINLIVLKKQLNITWMYSQNFYKQSTIKKLLREYKKEICDFVNYLQYSDIAINTNLDFPLACISQNQLDELNISFSTQVENIYQLSPLQEGLLFHRLYSANSTAYIIQLCWNIRDNLNIEIFKKAWIFLIKRHDVFRTSFTWKETKRPNQIVQSSVDLPWQYEDWRALSGGEKDRCFKSFIIKDRKISFDLSQAPLMRLILIRMGEGEYKFIWTHHHIVVDGWSVSVLLKEFSEVYNSLCDAREIVLEKSYPYVDYIQWLQNRSLDGVQNFWQNYLKGFADSCKLKILEPRAKDARKNLLQYSIEKTEIPLSFSQQAFSFARENKITLNALLQAVWALLLGFYCRTEDVLFGVTVSGRSIDLEKIESRVGLFINTIPLRVKLSYNFKPIEFLKNLQQNLAEIIHNSHASMAEIHSWCGVKSGGSLFDSILVFENYPVESNPDNENYLSLEKVKTYDPAHYQLTISIVPRQRIMLNFCYDTNVLNKKTIHKLMTDFQIILQGLISGINFKLGDITLLTAKESRKLFTEWEGKEHQYARTKGLSELFMEQVAQNPTKKALVCNGSSLTYQELNIKSNQMARYLRRLGVSKGTKVGISLDRGAELLISLLGTFKAGGIYVPLSMDYPPVRKKYILKDSEAKVLITKRGQWDVKNNKSLKRLKEIYLDEVKVDIEREAKRALAGTIMGADVAYVIYTSGSTGLPKGVLLKHRTINNLISWQLYTSKVKKAKRVAQFASIGFDVSLQEIFFTLLGGSTLYVISEEQKKSLKNVLKYIDESRIEQLFLPTVFLEYFVQEGLRGKEKYKSIKEIIVAGEALKITSDIRKFFRRNSHIRLVNHYGPSESHVVSSYVLPQEVNEWSERPFIGKAIWNTRLYILDKMLRPVSEGVAGELYISGDGLAEGYLNREELTQERFVTNCLNQKEEKMYATGDLVRWNAEGNLEYIGRMDDQLKIRGFRVELGEIEHCLSGYKGVKQSVVIVVKEKDQGNKRLVGYITEQRSESVKIEELMAYVKKQLPEYMVPILITKLKSLPLTVNGKIDKKALPELDLKRLTVESGYIKPSTPEQIALVNIWEDVLGVKRVGVSDNFFDLGGHSLAALQIMAQIYKILAVEIDIRVLFDAPSIAKLSDKIQRIKEGLRSYDKQLTTVLGKKTSNPVITLRHGGDKTPLFLIHPIGGTVFCYIPLVRYLAKNRPIYAVQDPGIEAKALLFDNFKELALFYIQAIKSIQKYGPYYIGGSSYGGNVSAEIARQMQKQGEEVLFVPIMDGWAIYPNRVYEDKGWFEANLTNQYKMLQKTLPGFKVPNLLFELHWQRNQMFLRYKMPKLYDINLTLFKAAETMDVLKEGEAKHNHWQIFSQRLIDLHMIPGDHGTMLVEPNVQLLAQKIDECMDGLENKK
jgi:amino acid adenylation domain-containing protein/non-ribosomal peptide synthase protein (TIGR01720 family)